MLLTFTTAAAVIIANVMVILVESHLKQYLSTWISAPLSAVTLLQGVLQKWRPAACKSARLAVGGKWKNWYTT